MDTFSIISNDVKNGWYRIFNKYCDVFNPIVSLVKTIAIEKHHTMYGGKHTGLLFKRMDSLFKSIAMLLFKLTTDQNKAYERRL